MSWHDGPYSGRVGDNVHKPGLRHFGWSLFLNSPRRDVKLGCRVTRVWSKSGGLSLGVRLSLVSFRSCVGTLDRSLQLGKTFSDPRWPPAGMTCVINATLAY